MNAINNDKESNKLSDIETDRQTDIATKKKKDGGIRGKKIETVLSGAARPFTV